MGEARALAATTSPPFVVTAEEQTRGRGRLRRRWHSPPGGGLYLTAALGFAGSAPSLPPFTLALGVALHRTVERILADAGADVSALGLKWPNDLLVGGRKIAGVLCETAGSTDGSTLVLAGVGLNVNARRFPAPLAERATSLALETGGDHEREAVLALLLARVEEAADAYARDGFCAFGAEYAGRCRLWGRRVRVDDVEGVLHGIDGTGALVVQHDDGTTTVVAAGHVELVPEPDGPRITPR
jgi:BirA family biotin operon repressor/biotin-[acetyl-CoA-carboxylase] ligase